MATVNIIFNPPISAFFNQDGNLVICDESGDALTNSSWGGINPPKSSLTFFSLSVVDRSGGVGYLDSSQNVDIDLLAAPYEFITQNSQVLIEGSAFSYLTVIYDGSNTLIDFNSPVLNRGIYTLIYYCGGTYTVGGDTVNWAGSFSIDPQMLNGVVNTQSNCLQDIMSSMSGINCKKNKKFMSLNRYLSFLNVHFNYQHTLNNSLTITDVLYKTPKVADLWGKIDKLCTGRDGGCQC